jgi:hypothetical protein
MTRLPLIGALIAAFALTAGAVAAFSDRPTAASGGLATASAAAGTTVPARDVSAVSGLTLPANGSQPAPDSKADLTAEANGTNGDHGAAVSAVATADDPTPDTNRGADVSAVAKDNHGQAIAAGHAPTTNGRPDGAGKPAGAGQPAEPGVPTDPGMPDGAGKPEGITQP